MDTVERAVQVIAKHTDWCSCCPTIDNPTAIAQALADAGLLAETRCRKCNGTGGTDLGGARCAVCDGTGHRRAET
jgi:DnaJ-class molecular chaperone